MTVRDETARAQRTEAAALVAEARRTAVRALGEDHPFVSEVMARHAEAVGAVVAVSTGRKRREREWNGAL